LNADELAPIELRISGSGFKSLRASQHFRGVFGFAASHQAGLTTKSHDPITSSIFAARDWLAYVDLARMTLLAEACKVL